MEENNLITFSTDPIWDFNQYPEDPIDWGQNKYPTDQIDWAMLYALQQSE
jgi:hypothetical protein